jgi:hypothetical protein
MARSPSIPLESVLGGFMIVEYHFEIPDHDSQLLM